MLDMAFPSLDDTAVPEGPLADRLGQVAAGGADGERRPRGDAAAPADEEEGDGAVQEGRDASALVDPVTAVARLDGGERGARRDGEHAPHPEGRPRRGEVHAAREHRHGAEVRGADRDRGGALPARAAALPAPRHGSPAPTPLRSTWTSTRSPRPTEPQSAGMTAMPSALSIVFRIPVSWFPEVQARNPPLLRSSRTRRKETRPGLRAKSSWNEARTRGRSRFRCPIILSSAGRTNCSNVSRVETGFPGSENTGFVPWTANAVGRPGLMSTFQNTWRTESSWRTSRTRSRSPMETPADVTSASARSPSVSSVRSDGLSSRAMPRFTGSPPICSTAAATASALLL